VNLTDFSIYLGYWAEVFTLVPIIIGLFFFNKYRLSLKLFWIFLLFTFLTDFTSEILRWNEFRNYFLNYFYSLWNCLLLISLYFFFPSNIPFKRYTFCSILVCIFFLLVDLLLVRGFKNQINYLSLIATNFITFLNILYTFIQIVNFKEKINLTTSIFSYVMLGLIISISPKLVFVIFTPFLLETALNYPLFFQLQNLVSFFSLFSLSIFSWALYQQRNI